MNGWISARDRLPENDDDVLIVQAVKNVPYIALGYYDQGGQMWYEKMGNRCEDWYERSLTDVLYWSGIPKLPSGLTQEGPDR